MSRTIIIGLDGVPYELIREYTKNGVMPNLKSIIKQGRFTKMKSSLPDNSAVSWSSMITGSNPGMHGIYGFTEMIPGSTSLCFPNYNKLQVKPFWQQYPDKRYVILNVPFTYPVKPMNGIHISGFISLDMKKAIYPSDLYMVAESLGYHIDVDTRVYEKSKQFFLNQLHMVTDRRMQLMKQIWHTRWDVFMVVFTGTDRLNHMMYHCRDEERFRDYYHHIDQYIGWIQSYMESDEQLILLSDHGMEETQSNVYLNSVLSQYGYNGKAVCLDPSRVYLRDKKQMNDVFDMFKGLTYKGRKVVKQVYYKEDIYHGPQTRYAPDMVLIPHHGFSLRGNHEKNMFTPPDKVTGHHTYDNAFLITSDLKDGLDDMCIENVLGLFEKELKN